MTVKPLLIPALIPAVAATLLSIAQAEEMPKPGTYTERYSYMMGVDIGKSFASNQVEINQDQFLAGIKDAVAKADLKLSPEEIAATMKEFQLKNMPEEIKDKAEANIEAGDTYRADNAQKDGVKETDSGLQYEVLTKAEKGAAKPSAEDTVSVHYHGTLIDGTVFDSSVERGQPATFPLNRVIPGWTEGVQLMSVGEKYRFVIPPDLGYGMRGAGGDIGPNETLIFEVELLEIEG